MLSFSNVNVLYEHRVTEIKGNGKVERIVITDLKTLENRDLQTDGVFIEIGLKANSDFLSGLTETNTNGEIIVDAYCKTSRKGIFAAGDITNVPYKQIVIAAGEGAKAALSACEYITQLNN
jgi:alkyl hydroperoxide reductase subunit AhpF